MPACNTLQLIGLASKKEKRITISIQSAGAAIPPPASSLLLCKGIHKAYFYLKSGKFSGIYPDRYDQICNFVIKKRTQVLQASGKREMIMAKDPNRPSLAEKFSRSLAGDIFTRYFKNDVGTRAAALTYYLIFSIFPILILISTLVGSFHINIDSMFYYLKNILPESILNLIQSYLTYLQSAPTKTLFSFAIFFSIYFPWRVVHGLMRTVRIAYGLPPARNQIRFMLKELLGALIIPFTLVVTLLMFVFGPALIRLLLDLVPKRFIDISEVTLSLWNILRFPLAAAIMSAALGIVYELSMDTHQPVKEILPGILFAILVWIASSMIFSSYVENFARYSVIYGTLGAFIVLLLWLYLTSLIFILGGELNAALAARRRKKALYPEMD